MLKVNIDNQMSEWIHQAYGGRGGDLPDIAVFRRGKKIGNWWPEGTDPDKDRWDTQVFAMMNKYRAASGSK